MLGLVVCRDRQCSRGAGGYGLHSMEARDRDQVVLELVLRGVGGGAGLHVQSSMCSTWCKVSTLGVWGVGEGSGGMVQGILLANAKIQGGDCFGVSKLDCSS